MKVLVVSSSFFPKIDGSTRCVYDHARTLAKQGNDVYLSTRGISGAPKSEVLEGIKVRRSSVQFRLSSLPNKVALILEQMANILMLQRKEKFSVIHVHGYVSGLAALPTKYLLGVPVVITTHGTEFLWPKDLWWRSPTQFKLELIFERFVLRYCDVVIAQSDGVRSYMVKTLRYSDSEEDPTGPNWRGHSQIQSPGAAYPGSARPVRRGSVRDQGRKHPSAGICQGAREASRLLAGSRRVRTKSVFLPGTGARNGASGCRGIRGTGERRRETRSRLPRLGHRGPPVQRRWANLLHDSRGSRAAAARSFRPTSQEGSRMSSGEGPAC